MGHQDAARLIDFAAEIDDPEDPDLGSEIDGF